MNIGFWNVNKNNISDVIVQMMIENGLDIICLAEVKSNELVIEIIKKYKKIKKENLFHIHNSKDKVIVLSRLQSNLFEDVSFLYQSSRLISFKMELKNKIYDMTIKSGSDKILIGPESIYITILLSNYFNIPCICNAMTYNNTTNTSDTTNTNDTNDTNKLTKDDSKKIMTSFMSLF
mgnify:CR=1 FL=1